MLAFFLAPLRSLRFRFGTFHGFLYHSLFIQPVLLNDRLPGIDPRAGPRWSHYSSYLYICTRYHTLLSIFHPPHHPPFFALGVIEDNYFITNGNCDFVLALGHEIVEYVTLLLSTRPSAGFKDLSKTFRSGSTRNFSKISSNLLGCVFRTGMKVNTFAWSH